MSIYKNNKKVIALYKGATPIKSVFKGSQLVFDSNVTQCTDVLSFDFTGDSNTFKINEYVYTATTSPYTVTLDELGVTEFTSASVMFNNSSALTSINSIPCTDNVTNMEGMFQKCSSLTSLDLSSLNTSNVTSMSAMFSRCSGLTSLDLSSFDTSNVTTMYGMFYECRGLTTLDLRSFNTSNVTSMNSMFYNCISLTSLNLSGWNTSNLTDMGYMFRKCSNLTSLNVSNWDISNVTSMGGIFANCTKLNELLIGNVDDETYNWWCARLTESNIDCNIIKRTSGNNYIELLLNNPSGDITINNQMSRINDNNTVNNGDGTYTYKVDASRYGFGSPNDNYSEAFINCTSLVEVKCLYFPNTVVDCAEMFSNCTNLQKINAEGWEVSHLTNYSNVNNMFDNCTSLTKIVLGKVDAMTFEWWNRRLQENGLIDIVEIEATIV